MSEQPTPGVEHGGGDQTLIAVYEAALIVASELRLDVVLQRIVDLARQVVPARYAALGVADDQGRILEFITSGINGEEQSRIGAIPTGRGLLGVLIHGGLPLIVSDIAKDSRSVGFPPNHPPMASLVGVPIKLGERSLGDLYLTERIGRPEFDERDLAALEALAAHAATAIERARLYQDLGNARRRAEEQRDHLSVILNNLPSAVVICDAAGVPELANSAAIAMFGGDEGSTALPVSGTDYRLLQSDGTPLRPDDRPEARAAARDSDRNRQLLLERKDGARLPVLVQSAELLGSDDGPKRIVVVMQDVTQLREAEQLRDDFFSLVSHEFRTPLATVHGGAYLLANQGNQLDGQTRAELLTDIVVESDRLDRMLTNMLNLTAIQAGHLTPNTEPVLIDSLARRAAQRVGAQSPRHHFRLEIPAGLPPVEADPDLLEQVFVNLYENAVKYSPEGGDIVTTANRAGDTIEIRVTDPGIGIAPEHATTVFERFRRVGGDPTVRGMGLGLYLSRHLVEAQRGTIRAISPGIGFGSTFAVTLPIAEGWSESDLPRRVGE